MPTHRRPANARVCSGSDLRLEWHDHMIVGRNRFALLRCCCWIFEGKKQKISTVAFPCKKEGRQPSALDKKRFTARLHRCRISAVAFAFACKKEGRHLSVSSEKGI
ncbi:hypothetical protein ACLOJK_035283 [Asimina triloba]